MMTRPRRDTEGASVVEYVLLLAMVVLVVVATLYALGRSPDRPASVLGDTFRNPPSGGGTVDPVPDCPGPPNHTTTTIVLCRPTS